MYVCMYLFMYLNVYLLVFILTFLVFLLHPFYRPHFLSLSLLTSQSPTFTLSPLSSFILSPLSLHSLSLPPSLSLSLPISLPSIFSFPIRFRHCLPLLNSILPCLSKTKHYNNNLVHSTPPSQWLYPSCFWIIHPPTSSYFIFPTIQTGTAHFIFTDTTDTRTTSSHIPMGTCT